MSIEYCFKHSRSYDTDEEECIECEEAQVEEEEDE